MVFLSTCQVLLGRPLTRSVFAFGTRSLTQRILIEELAVGLWLVLPLSCIIALLTKRWATYGWCRPYVIRRDVWTTLIITIVGDLFLELLLPSLKCLPTQHPFEAKLSYFEWLKQGWGFDCPVPMDRSALLSTDSVGTLLTIRLIFMCCGVYIGEAFCPVALTGGIACGKSTVCKLLGNPSQYQQQQAQPQSKRTARRSHTKAKKPKSVRSSSTLSSSGATVMASSASDEEVSFLIIDTDKIAHEILLPPSVLAAGHGWGGGFLSGVDEDDEEDEEGDDDDEEAEDNEDRSTVSGGAAAVTSFSTTTTTATHTTSHPGSLHRRHSRRRPRYVVSANDSVYRTILETFGDESDNYFNILTPNNLIDRDKLGAMVFGDKHLRKRLNRITHPRIFVTMMKQILYGSFGTSYDVVCADIPLFFESMASLRHMFGLVIVVACTKEVQFQRLKKRNPELTPAQCWERINAQMPISQKVEMADIVVWNNGDMEELVQEVERVRREVMGRMFGIGMSLLQMLLLVGGSLSLAVSSKLFTSWSI